MVEGSVGRAGTRVRITAQLIDAATDHHLWTDSVEGDLADVLTLQSDVAQALVRGIGATVGARADVVTERPRVDPEAYDAFLKVWVQGWQDRSQGPSIIEAYERVIELDPSFAPAYAGLADFMSYLAMTGFMPAGDAYLRSRQLASRAVELDPDLPYAHAVLARVHFQYEWDWAAAEAELERALDLDPSDMLALGMSGAYRVLVHGDCDGGLSQLEAARDRDPFNDAQHFDLGIYLFHCRRWDASIAEMRRTIELAPAFEFPREVLAWNYAAKGWRDRAAEQCDEALAGIGERFEPGTISSCAWVNGQIGRPDAARQLVTRLRNPPGVDRVDPAFLSYGCLAVKDVDCAITHLEEALRQRSSTMVFMRVAPAWDPVRDDPRFKAILEQMKFPS